MINSDSQISSPVWIGHAALHTDDRDIPSDFIWEKRLQILREDFGSRCADVPLEEVFRIVIHLHGRELREAFGTEG